MLSREIDILSSSVTRFLGFQNTEDGYTNLLCPLPATSKAAIHRSGFMSFYIETSTESTDADRGPLILSRDFSAQRSLCRDEPDRHR